MLDTLSARPVNASVRLPSHSWRIIYDEKSIDETVSTLTARIDEPVVAININRQYPRAKNAEDLYQATRSMWRLNREHAGKAQYAFAVYQSDIK